MIMPFKRWATNTPHYFRFTVKLPRYIIEDTYKVSDFLEELSPLEEKILAVIIESPPPNKLTLGNGGREWLDDILGTCTYHGYSDCIGVQSHVVVSRFNI